MDTKRPVLLQRNRTIGKLTLAFIAAFGADCARSETWQITPLIGVTETYSNNMDLVSTSPQQGWATEIAPGIRVDGQSAKLRAYLDYRRQNIYYQGNSGLNNHQNQLDAFAKLEAIDNWLFVDASSNIVQRSLSVFGPASVAGTSASANRVETRTALVSPYIRGQMSDFADYMVRYGAAELRSDNAAFSDTRADQYAGSLRSHTSGAVGWFGDVIGVRVKNDLIGDRDNTRVRAGVVVPVSAHLHLTASGGRERSNYGSDSRETINTSGTGFEWSPSKHTQFAGLREKRFFGYGHSLLFSHRTALTAWRYSDNKDVATLGSLLGGYSPGTVQELMSDLLESSIPDPVERSRAVRSKMDMSGSAASLSGADGVLSSRLFVERVREASVALLGVRNTLTFLVRQRDQELLAGAPVATDSFSASPEIRERSASLAWLYRLAPLTTLNASLFHRKSDAMTVSGVQERQNAQTVALSFGLSAKATASLGARRMRSDGGASGLVRENAVVASFTQRF